MTKPNFDQQELEKFAALAAHWWDPQGELKTLHQINPLRLEYISEKVKLSGKNVIDIGCGGGILAESMALLGANVTGIDLNQSLIQVGKLHQYETGAKLDYQYIAAETIAAEKPAEFDVITCLEMLEHVPDPCSIVKACGQLVKPGGDLFFSTINRNPKSYLFAILGAEYLLRLLPKNTHHYEKFIRPSELSTWLRQENIETLDIKGISYNPLTKQFKLTNDITVNYILYAKKSTS